MAGKQTNLRLDPELKQFYIDLGKKNERDYHFYIRKALEKYRDEHGQESKVVAKPKKELPEWAEDVIQSFWDAYPKKTDKKKAIDRLRKMIAKNPVASDYMLIISRVKEKALYTDKQFFASPDRYLRDELWNDEIIKGPQDNRQAQLEQMDRERGFGQVIEGEVQSDLLLGHSND